MGPDAQEELKEQTEKEEEVQQRQQVAVQQKRPSPTSFEYNGFRTHHARNVADLIDRPHSQHNAALTSTSLQTLQPVCLIRHNTTGREMADLVAQQYEHKRRSKAVAQKAKEAEE